MNNEHYIEFANLIRNKKVDDAINYVIKFIEKNGIKNTNSFLIQSSQMDDVAISIYFISVTLTNSNGYFHNTCRDILSGPICHFEGAGLLAIHHSKEACIHNPGDIFSWESYLELLTRFDSYDDNEVKRIREAIKGNVPNGTFDKK